MYYVLMTATKGQTEPSIVYGVFATLYDALKALADGRALHKDRHLFLAIRLDDA